jgi:hypothetical protein
MIAPERSIAPQRTLAPMFIGIIDIEFDILAKHIERLLEPYRQ